RALRVGEVDVSRTADRVDSGDSLGAIGEGGDRLRAADADYAVDAGERRGGEHERVRVRAHHDELADARDPGRHRVHQHRGRIGRLAAGHVEADAAEGAYPLA